MCCRDLPPAQTTICRSHFSCRFFSRLQGLLRRSQWIVAEKNAAKGRAADGKDSAVNANAAGANVAVDSEVFSFNGKTIDFGTLELRVNGTTIQLTLMEAKLLRHLIRSKGRTVSRKSILEDVWGLHEDTDTRAIDNFIVRLRRYIEKDPSQPKHLLTVRGVGYRFLA